MSQIFSAEQLRLNGVILSGNGATNSRLFYNGSGLLFIGEATQGGSSSSGAYTGQQVIGGSGLFNVGGITTIDHDITLNIGAVSGLGVAADTIGIQFDGPSINLNSSGYLQVNQIAPSRITGLIQNAQLQNNSVTVTAGSGLSNGGNVALGGTITLDILTRSGVMVSGAALIARYDGTTINVNAAEKLQVVQVPNSLTNGLGIDTLSFNGSAASSVKVDSSQVVMMTGAQSIAGDKTFSNNVRVAGSLTVDGTVVTVNSETVTIADNLILLNSNVTGAVSPTENAGIEIARGNQTYADLIWNETSGKWQAGVSGATYNILTENRIQALRIPLATNDISKTVNYNPITTSLSGVYVAIGTLSSTGAAPDLIGCMLSGFATSTSATFYFTAPIPNNFYSLGVMAYGF